MEELRRCPFCGGRADLNKDYLGHFYISCGKCEIMTDSYVYPNMPIAAWNRRVTQNIGKKECFVQDEEQEV